MPKNPIYTFKIGGEAGFGIMSAGLNFSKIAVRSGYYIFNYIEYPSLIRGGHNVMQVTFSLEPVFSQLKTTDFLVALNQETINIHANELKNNAIVLYDTETVSDLSLIKNETIKKIGISLSEIVRTAGGAYIMRNNVALGAICAAIGVDPEILLTVVTEELKKANPEIIEMNKKACFAGYESVHKNHKESTGDFLNPQPKKLDKLIVTANDSAALGAIAAGMGFCSIYPMTPTSNILHVLTPLQEKFGFVFKQPEDEISAINMAIGASYAGTRAMVATSGGGFCLMTEAYGLAGITETPVVIIEGMRGGPSTGLPTWTEQGDLKFVLNASQGDFLRIVLSAGDSQEAFNCVFEAFNLAEKYQTPVLVLIDRYMCESHYCVDPFDTSKLSINRGKLLVEAQSEDYKRYLLEQDGISPRSLPGSGSYFVTNSDEHDEFGYSEEGLQNRLDQHEKRNRKIELLQKEDMQPPQLFGPAKADITVISWGSNKGPILEALKSFSNINFIHNIWMNPFPVVDFLNLVKAAKKTIILECNYSGQFSGVLKEKTGFEPDEMFLKYDGRPFYPEDIIEKLIQMGGKA